MGAGILPALLVSNTIAAGTPCTLPECSGMHGWRCTREEGHLGPCAAEPVYADDDDADTFKPVTPADIAIASGIALVCSFIACCLWYSFHAF